MRLPSRLFKCQLHCILWTYCTCRPFKYQLHCTLWTYPLLPLIDWFKLCFVRQPHSHFLCHFLFPLLMLTEQFVFCPLSQSYDYIHVPVHSLHNIMSCTLSPVEYRCKYCTLYVSKASVWSGDLFADVGASTWKKKHALSFCAFFGVG